MKQRREVLPPIRLLPAGSSPKTGEVIAELKVTTRGRMTMPKKVRDLWDLRPGDHMKYEKQTDGSYLIIKVQPKASRGGK